jgi:hypothetical protein
MAWYLVKHMTHLHSVVLNQVQNVFMAWYLVNHRTSLRGAVLC